MKLNLRGYKSYRQERKHIKDALSSDNSGFW